MNAKSAVGLLSDEVVDDFREHLHGTVFTPDDPGYDDARIIWNGLINRKPALIARCSGTADVIASVNFARANELTIAIKGGGHNVAGHALADDALLIDLTAMRGVQVDPTARLVRVQGGATWSEVDRETQVYGLVAPGGMIAKTGVAGLTLHGGMGHTRRKHGLSIDNLRSVEIVTADGKAQTASERENPDLFWAIRGAGSNFGVVTSFEFQLHSLGPEVFLCAPIYPIEESPALIREWRTFMENAPEEISSNVIFWTIPPGFPAELVGKQIVILAALHAGRPEEGERATRRLRELSTPILDLGGTQPFTQVQSGFDPFFPNGQHAYWKSLDLEVLTDEMIDEICQIAQSRQSSLSSFSIWHHGGAMNRVHPSAMAYNARRSSYMLGFEATWTNPDDDDRNIEWARGGWDRMHKYAAESQYLNFPGLGEERQKGDLVRAAYGENYERLAQLKAQYDPENLFRHNQNITPASKGI